MTEAELTRLLGESFDAALRAAEPGAMVERHLPDEEPALILAVGKGALGMLAAARRRAPLTPWLASPPHARPPSAGSGVSNADDGNAAGGNPAGGLILSGSHPVPDAGSEAAAEAALAAVRNCGPEDLVLVLVSGGGSALWSAPRGVDLTAKREVIERLLVAGADISQLNVVRKHLSGIKGGLLARATRARLLTLALSDVPGDDPGTIASGPTVADASTYAQALAVLDEFTVTSEGARRHLAAGVDGLLPETPKPGDEIETRSRIEVVGSNQTLLAAAAAFWRARGYPVVVLSDALTGESRVLARAHAELVSALVHGDDFTQPLAALAPTGAAASLINQLSAAARAARERPLVVLSGGETTVTVAGKGRGGRNQEFALWLHHYLRRAGDDEHVAALIAGSDGIDGNSPAAGATISVSTGARAEAHGISPAAYLQNNDSYSFFQRLGDTVITGPSGTNLNDYRVLVVSPAA